MITSRSRFLVHWTGKDIDSEVKKGVKHGFDTTNAYVERLVNTLSTGLWMMEPTEVIGCRNALFTYKVPMTCFTEILLSRVRDHASRYGRLGFGFDRKFVLEQGGSPVLYIRQHPEDMVLQRINGIFRRIDGAVSLLVDIEEEGSFMAIDELSEAEELLKQVAALLKPMSNWQTDDFVYLEEAEWRIMYHDHWYRLIKQPRKIPIGMGRAMDTLGEKWDKPPNIVPSGREKPPFYLTFKPDELSLLIFPDAVARKEAWSKPEFHEWLEKRSCPLPMLTLDECESF